MTSPACASRPFAAPLPIRAGIGLALSFIALPASSPAQVQCIDYGTATHWVQAERLDRYPLGVSLEGSLAFLLDSGAGLRILDAGRPGELSLLGSVDLEATFATGDVDVSGTLALVAAHDSLWVVDVSFPQTPRIQGRTAIPAPVPVLPLSGFLLAQGSLAYVAGSSGLVVVDVSDPTTPAVVGTAGNSGWSLAGSGNLVFLLSSTEFQVIDVADPVQPAVVGSLAVGGFGVAARDAYVYVTSGSPAGVIVLDVSDPTRPSQVGLLETTGTAWTLAVSDSRLVVPTSSARVFLYDLSKPGDPELIESIPLLHADVFTMDAAGSLALLPQQTCDHFNCYPVLGMLDMPGASQVQPLGQSDPRGVLPGLVVRGNCAYLAGAGGLTILDTSAPGSPRYLGSLATPEHPYGLAVTGELALVADYLSGLLVVDVSDPEAPALLRTVDTGNTAVGVAATASHAYVANGGAGLCVVDLSEPASAGIVGSVDTPYFAMNVTLSGTHAFVADYASGLQVVDVSDPAHPVRVGGVETPGNAQDVALAGAVADVADQSSVTLVDVTIPEAPVILGSVGTFGNARGIDASLEFAYVADLEYGLSVIDIRDAGTPRLIGGWTSDGYTRSWAVEAADYVYLTAGGLRVFPWHCADVTSTEAVSFEAVPRPEGLALTWSWDPGLGLAPTSLERAAYPAGPFESLPLDPILEGASVRFLDPQPLPGTTAWYRLSCLDRAGNRFHFGPYPARFELPGPGPQPARLEAPSPNPLRGHGSVATIPFVLAHPSRIRLDVFHPGGQRVRRLVEGPREAGPQSVRWDGRDDMGRALPAGVYLLRLEASGLRSARRIVLLP